MPVTFSGLSSGLDTGRLIEQLTAASRTAAQPIETKRTNLGRQKTIVSDLGSKLRALTDSVRALDTASEVRALKPTITDNPHVGIAVSGTAGVSTHTLRVGTLARAQIVSSRTFASQDAGVLSAGGVTISSAGRDPVSVSWGSGDSLAAVADRIRSSEAGVDASVLYDGSSYRLVVSARDTGTAAAPTFVDSGDGLALANPANVMTAARDASFTLNGVPMTRGRNVVGDAISGVTFTLKKEHAATDPDTILPIVADDEGARAKMQKVVDAYNAVNDVVQGQLRYDGAKKTTATLFGDPMLRGLQLALSGLTTRDFNGTSLAQLGIKRDNAGKLTLDAAAFDKVINANPEAVEKLMVTERFAQQLADLSDRYTRGGDGILASKTSSIDSQVKLYSQQIENIENNATELGRRLERQFTQLERAMAQFQNQAGFLSAVL